MERCPICDESLREALVVCRYCGEVLPLRVVVVSEGSHGDGGFAVVVKDPRRRARRALNDEEDEEVVDAS